jgi:hypothetical protein
VGGSPLAVAHLAFAVGIVPLIFAAMSHFVPVLTRTGNPGFPDSPRASGWHSLPAWLPCSPCKALLPRWLLIVAAAVDLVLAAILLNWIVGRARATLGRLIPAGAGMACFGLPDAGPAGVLLIIDLWPAYWKGLCAFFICTSIRSVWSAWLLWAPCRY